MEAYKNKKLLSFIDYDNFHTEYLSHKDLETIKTYIYFTRILNLKKDTFTHLDTNFKIFNFMKVIKNESIEFEDTKILNKVLTDLSILKSFERFHDTLKIRSNYYELYKKIEDSCYFIVGLIKENSINEIWFIDVPHLPLEILTYRIAEILKIEIKLIFWLPRKISEDTSEGFVCGRINQMPQIFSTLIHKKYPNNLDKPSKQNLNNLTLNVNYVTAPDKKPLLSGYKISKFLRMNENIGLLLSGKKIFSHFIFVIKSIDNQMKLNEIIRFGRNIAETKLPKDIEYFYFPLHYQPEATTQIRAGIYDNQLNLILLILNYLPDNTLLVVKEHPAYWQRKWNTKINSYRSLEFYRTISRNKKILFINHNYSSNGLLENACGVIGLTGTIVLEAIKAKKLTMLFGQTPYLDFPNVISPKNEKIIQDFLTKKYYFNESVSFNSLSEIISSFSFNINFKALESNDLTIKYSEYNKIVKRLVCEKL